MRIMNLEKLKTLCDKHTVSVNFNGVHGFTHDVINADRLLDEIASTSDLDKDVFINNINSGNFMTPEYEEIFHSIKFYGKFRIKGHEALNGAKAYIVRKDLTWLDKD